MREIIDKYQELLDQIPTFINQSKFKKEYIISRLNLTRSTFYNKLKNKTFTYDELVILSNLLFPEEAHNYELKKSIEQGLKDIKEGSLSAHEDVIQSFRQRYGE